MGIFKGRKNESLIPHTPQVFCPLQIIKIHPMANVQDQILAMLGT
jgi:hypothetical protein